MSVANGSALLRRSRQVGAKATHSTALPNTTSHLLQNVLSAAADYERAENGLSLALLSKFEDHGVYPCQEADWVLALDECERESQLARRRAAELAIAIDGLTDRAAIEINMAKQAIRREISSHCVWPGTTYLRDGAFERVRAVANAYKHFELRDPTLPIRSDRDVLVVGAGYGVDDYGVGKFGGAEVLVCEPNTGAIRKFLADVPVAVGAWLSFLSNHGAAIGPGPLVVCGVNVSPS